MKTRRPNFTKVSEWIAAGALSTGFFLIETPVKETEKALAFNAVKMSAYGNPYLGVTWLPKSQLVEVENDYYTQGPAKAFVCPAWLYSKSFPDGECL